MRVCVRWLTNLLRVPPMAGASHPAFNDGVDGRVKGILDRAAGLSAILDLWTRPFVYSPLPRCIQSPPFLPGVVFDLRCNPLLNSTAFSDLSYLM